jgi:hypothetical protein
LRRPPGARTIAAQIRNLFGFFSHTGVLNSELKRLAQIEIFRVVMKSGPWRGFDDLTWDVVDDYASYIHGLARICGSDVVGNV